MPKQQQQRSVMQDDKKRIAKKSKEKETDGWMIHETAFSASAAYAYTLRPQTA